MPSNCKIYGQENTRFLVNIAAHVNGPLVPDSVEWTITDTNWADGSNNDSTWTGLNEGNTVTKIFQSPGVKNITCSTLADDGWGNIYKHEETVQVVVYEYDEPIIEWTYNPDPFRINQTFVVDPDFQDRREINLLTGESLQSFGYVNQVDWYMDYTNKPTEITFNGLDYQTFEHSYNVKKQYKVMADVEWWNGWYYIRNQYFDEPVVANSPPIANYTLRESGICVTKLVLTDVASDPDGIQDIVARRFELYKETVEGSDSYALINSEDINWQGAYSYQFALEGRYKVLYTVRDSENATNTKESIYDIIFKECGDGSSSTGTGSMSGIIQLQPGWQLIAIPTVHGYWNSDTGSITKDNTISTVSNYLLDQLAFKLGIDKSLLNQHVQVCIAYRGGELSQNMVVGFTPETSVNNFQLCYVDPLSTKLEFTAFWIKVISPLAQLPMIEWEYHYDDTPPLPIEAPITP